jgi:hypothetical protein
MGAMLRMLAMFWSNLVTMVGMRFSRLSGECHTEVTPQALPQPDRDSTKETTFAATSSQTPIALMLRPSKHEGVLTAARDESSSGKAEGRIPRIPVLETRELSTRPAADPTRILGTRRSPPDLIRGLAEDDSRESRRLLGHAPTRICGHIAPS